MSGPLNGDDLLAKINPALPRARAHICLRPDLIRQWEALSADELAAKAAKADTSRLATGGDGADPKKLKKAKDKLESDIQEASVWFEFEALPVAEFQRLSAKHAPRRGDQFDAMAGYDRDAVHDELVRVCLVDPVFSEDGWRQLTGKLAASEWNELRETAVEVNGELTEVPK